MEKNNRHFIIRSYRQGDEYAINAMFNEVFNQNRDISHWYWKYRDNPYGKYIISLAESEEGILAAHYAGYPVKICHCHSNNSVPDEFTTYHLGDKMTREQFRSIGFGKSSLMTKTFVHFRETFGTGRDVPFAYGFTTHHSKRFGMLFLGYADNGPVTYRTVDCSSLNKINIEGPDGSSGTIIEEVSVLDETWTEFFYSVAPHYKYLVKKDAAYLKWRYLQRPDKKYLILSAAQNSKIAGWSVFCREGRKIIWGDALFMPGDSNSVRTLFGYLQKHALATDADFIECWFPPRPAWWDTLLQTLGFETKEEPNKLHITPPVFTNTDATDTLKNYFYYTMGDSDLF